MKLTDIRQALKAYAAAKNSQTVGDAEAQHRSRVCAACPMRRKVAGFIGRASQLLGAASSTGQVPPELSDYKCGVCKCSLLLLVPALPENLHKDSPEERATREKKAPACWLLKNS